MKASIVLFNLLALLLFVQPLGIVGFVICVALANLAVYLDLQGQKHAAEREKTVLLSAEKLKQTGKFKRGNNL